MKKFLPFFILILAGCNPYQPYQKTHLNILADIDPRTGVFDINLQMVYISGKDHSDSIVFNLDKAFTIISLSAQELVRYELPEENRLVLYIQKPVSAGDRLHISMSYSGITGFRMGPDMDRLDIDSIWKWLPTWKDMGEMTYRINAKLPEGFLLENGNRYSRSENTWIVESMDAGLTLNFGILMEAD